MAARLCICHVWVEDRGGRPIEAGSQRAHACIRPEWDGYGWPANQAAQVVAARKREHPEGLLAEPAGWVQLPLPFLFALPEGEASASQIIERTQRLIAARARRRRPDAHRKEAM